MWKSNSAAFANDFRSVLMGVFFVPDICVGCSHLTGEEQEFTLDYGRPSYNILLTCQYLLVVPRQVESPYDFSVNSMGFLGL